MGVALFNISISNIDCRYIDIDIDIDNDMVGLENIDIDKAILENIYIDKAILKNIDIHDHIDINIFQKCRYIDNQYVISIYRTGLDSTEHSLVHGS